MLAVAAGLLGFAAPAAAESAPRKPDLSVYWNLPYVCRNAPWVPEDNQTDDAKRAPQGSPGTDIQAILTVLSRRPHQSWNEGNLVCRTMSGALCGFRAKVRLT